MEISLKAFLHIFRKGRCLVSIKVVPKAVFFQKATSTKTVPKKKRDVMFGHSQTSLKRRTSVL